MLVMHSEWTMHIQYTLYIVVGRYGYAEMVFSVQSDNLSLCQTHSFVSLIAINSCLSESILQSLLPSPPKSKFIALFSLRNAPFTMMPAQCYIWNIHKQMNKWTNEWNENRRENPFTIQLTNCKQWVSFQCSVDVLNEFSHTNQKHSMMLILKNRMNFQFNYLIFIASTIWCCNNLNEYILRRSFEYKIRIIWTIFNNFFSFSW